MCLRITVKPQKTEITIVTKTWFYRQAAAKCSMLASMLHLALKCGRKKPTKIHILKISVFLGFTVSVKYRCYVKFRANDDCRKLGE